MDPLAGLLHRAGILYPEDHTMDSVPFTALVCAVAVVAVLALVVRLNGGRGKRWSRPAFSVLVVWWAGVEAGHFGLSHLFGIVFTLLAVGVLYEPAWQTFRAALEGHE